MWQSFPAQNPDTPARTIDGEALVITPTDSRLHALNETATFVWDRAQGRQTLESILGELMSTYAVSEKEARADVEAFVNEAVDKGLLLLHAEPIATKDG
jgi:hypothetical protein